MVLLLFGRGKISDLMGDVAQGIKAFKKGMQDDTKKAEKPAEREKPSTTSDAGAHGGTDGCRQQGCLNQASRTWRRLQAPVEKARAASHLGYDDWARTSRASGKIHVDSGGVNCRHRGCRVAIGRRAAGRPAHGRAMDGQGAQDGRRIPGPVQEAMREAEMADLRRALTRSRTWRQASRRPMS